jgi:hypothetical protein
LKILQDVVAKNPDYYRARYNLGLLYTSLRQYRDAIEQFEQAARIAESAHIEDLDLPIDLGWAYALAGRSKDAEAQYTKAWNSVDRLDAATRNKLLTRRAYLYVEGGEAAKLEDYKAQVRAKWGDNSVKAFDDLKPTQVSPRAAMAGWVYYALLADSARGVWQDENFEKTQGDGKVPKEGDTLRCRLTMNVRADVFRVEKGREIWPPVVGSIRANDTVTVESVVTYPAGPGIHYWIKVRRNNR